jgi:hypothetical protein
MIYLTTFILTILLSHIARATPACGDVASPEELYNPAFADAQQDQHTLLPIVRDNVKWTHNYGPNHSTKGIACPNIAHRYPLFKDIPLYPYIGGIWIIKDDPKFCGTCWNLTAVKTRKTIFVIAIDSSEPGWFNLSETAFILLNSSIPPPGISLQATFREVDGFHCGIKK